MEGNETGKRRRICKKTHEKGNYNKQDEKGRSEEGGRRRDMRTKEILEFGLE